MRLNCWVPDELGERLRSELDGVNVSAVLQRALRDLLECSHERLVCAECGELVDAAHLGEQALALFWGELLWAWQPLVDKGGTAEGAARVAKTVAVQMGVPRAESRPLPRPPRMRRAS